MSNAEKELLKKWCYDNDLTYFFDGKKHCLCNVSWIIRFDTENEMIKYVKERL